MLAVQCPNHLSAHCHVKGWVARHTHAKASSRMHLAGGTAYLIRSQHAVPTVLKSRRHTRHPWARDTRVFSRRNAGWWASGLLRAVICTCVMGALMLLCQPSKPKKQPAAKGKLYASPKVPLWVLRCGRVHRREFIGQKCFLVLCAFTQNQFYLSARHGICCCASVECF